jgi:hypothetical protein
MKKPKMFYFEQEDTLHLVIVEGEASGVELRPDILAELDVQGKAIKPLA